MRKLTTVFCLSLLLNSTVLLAHNYRALMTHLKLFNQDIGAQQLFQQTQNPNQALRAWETLLGIAQDRQRRDTVQNTAIAWLANLAQTEISALKKDAEEFDFMEPDSSGDFVEL
ncbi:MAG: hypothetical protein WCK42_01435 [Myxococcaceae bacterium]